MDEGDDYVPQITQMDYSLMGDGGAGQGTTPTYYDPAMQIYGAAGVADSSSAAAVMASQHQQRYGVASTAAGLHHHQQHQQLMQSQQNAQQQRHYMAHQMAPPAQQQMFQMGMSHAANSAMEMISRMPGGSSAAGSSSALQSAQQATNAAAVQSSKSASKSKTPRKSKKALAAEAASAEAAAAAATAASSTNKSQNMVDSRGFPLSAQPQLPPGYQTLAGFNSAVYQQQQAYAMQQKYLYMQQQHQQQQTAGQQQQQQHPSWMADPMMNPAAYGHNPHSSTAAAAQTQQPSAYPTGPPSSANFHGPAGYAASGNGMPMSNAGYYPGMKPPFADQQQHAAGVTGYCAYGGGNVPTSSAVQAQQHQLQGQQQQQQHGQPQPPVGRFPASSSYMSAPADSTTPCASSAAATSTMANAPPVPSGMHPYYAAQQQQQQQQQHFPHMPYGAATAQQQAGGAKPPHLQAQQAHINSSTPTTLATQTPVTSTMMPQFSTLHQQQQQTSMQQQQQQQQSHGGKDGQPHGAQQTPWGAPTGMSGFNDQPSGYPPAGSSGQLPAAAHPVMMQFHQQLQQIHADQQRLHREIYDCDVQINFLQQQQPRTPELTQRIEQLKQQSNYERSQFAALQQKQACIMSSMNALSEQQKQQAYMQASGGVPSKQMATSAVLHGGPVGLGAGMMPMMPSIGQLGQPAMGSSAVATQMDLKFASMTPTPSQPPPQPQPPARQPPSMLSSPALNSSQVSPTGFKKAMEFGVSSASSAIPPSSSFSVMQTSANQVQVNITPEPTGRTLISVYHQQYQMATPVQEQVGLSGTTPTAANEYSIPPEPVPPKRQSVVDGDISAVPTASFPSNNTIAALLPTAGEPTTNAGLSPPPTVPTNSWEQPPIRLDAAVSMTSAFNSAGHGLTVTTSISTPTTSCSSLTTRATTAKVAKERKEKESLKVEETLATSDLTDDIYAQAIASPRPAILSPEPAEVVNDEDVAYAYYDPFNESSTSVNTAVVGTSAEMSDMIEIIPHEVTDEAGATVVTPNDYTTVAEIDAKRPSQGRINNGETEPENDIGETKPNGDLSTRKAHEDLVTALAEAEDLLTAENNNGGDEKHEVISFEQQEEATIEEAEDDPPLIEKQLQPLLDSSLLLARPSKRKGRKTKATELTEEGSLDDTDDYTETKPIKKKKKASSKDRSKEHKASASRKRRRQADGNLSSGEDDENDGDFVVRHKKKKISKAAIAKELNVAEENLDDFVEKRRSGRKKVNKNYGDREMDVDLDELVMEDLPSSSGHKAEHQSTSTAKSNAAAAAAAVSTVDDDALFSAPPEDCASGVEAPQEEWIVEKILGYRLAKRKVRKEFSDKKPAVREAPQPDDESVAATETADTVPSSSSKAGGTTNEMIQEPGFSESTVVDGVDELGIRSTEESDVTVDGERTESNKIELKSEAVDENENEMEPSSSQIAEERGQETIEMDENKEERENESTTKSANKSGKEKEANNKNDDGEEVEEEAEQYYVKYKNRSYIHCEWKFADELETMDKRAAGKITRYKMKCSDVVNGEEYFNEDYVIVDRVLDDVYDEEDEEYYAYVKWRSLPYGECSWESIKNVPQSKIDAARNRNFVVDTFKLKEMSRPSPKEWKKISSDRVFKDGNTLREYQVEGVNWLLFCYFNRQNCILADEMGLGKTVQTITFLQGVYDLGIHGPFLIVVPLSTLHNWEREFETWTNMNAVVYHGSAAGRQIIQDYELYYAKSAVRGESKKKPVIKFDALITTFEMVVSDCEVLRRINYRVCVIDEAHRLKNRNCKLLTGGLGAFKMEHRVLLTGTPLQNNIQELYSLLNFLEPERFSSSESFLEQFGQFGQCQTEEQVQKLQEILKPMMLRRLKEDVEKTLQPKEETIIEIQLSNIQKKYYRAILERNFTHLIKGGSMPSLMNTMMELRKCCNHPFLINGAEEQIMSEVRAANPDCESEEQLQAIGLTQASGKLVLIDKLLPKLRQDGHKVLIFSQMVRMLDLIEEFLVHKSYPFERIDGNVRGDLRQAAIDRFSRQDTERFVFLLCTRAGGLGINLTAADTVIIFDSDWNPQNDLQAQARCHRIGQTKMVKVYRLITSNTYEREMFDKASLKLGLDKAVLQSMAPRDSGQQLTRKEVEDLLRKGAYGAVMEEDNEGSKFSEEDIDTILQRRTQTIRLEPGIRGSTFAKASFTSSDNREDIDINDPNFWSKWAKKVNIDVDAVLTAKKTPNDENLILLEPRSRRKRFEENYNKASESADESAAVSADDDSEGMNGNASTSRNGDGNDGNVSSPSKKIGIGTWKKRRRATTGLAHEDGDEDYVGGIGISASGYRPNELAFNKSEFFKVEKLLGAWGWGRWTFVKQKTEIALSENDMEHISRTLLLYCVREFRGDEKIRDFVWRLITPRGGLVCKSGEKSDFSGGIYHEGWAALPEYNPPSFAVDHSFQRHVHRHANKLLARIHHLQFLQTRVIREQGADLAEDCIGHADVQLQMPNAGDPPMPNWDVQCDKSFLLGVYKHGMENYESMRQDPKLCFIEKGIAEMPTILELNTRFKRLISMLQRQIEAAAAAAENAKSPKMTRWPRNEEVDYMNVLRTYGVKDDSSTANVINWTRFRELSTCLQNKTDAEMLEQLYCVLAMCTRQQGGELSPVDQKRAECVETITGQQAEKLMNRIHLMRKIHAIITTNVHNVRASLKLCSTSAMPKDWAEAHDEALLIVVDKYGLDGILPRLANNPAFQKISGIEERMMLRRIVEICTTLETGKWNGIASIDLIEDDEPNSSGSIGRYARQKTNDSSRASSGSPGPIRGRGASRRPPTAASGSARSAQRTGDASAKSGKSGNASGTANITSVTSLDLAELEKEKMKSLMQQHQSLLEKAGQTNANYMMSLLGLSGLTSTAAPSSSKSTATTSAASSSAMQVQAALLAMTSAFGVSDAATASALASMLTGIPMSSLLDGTTATSSSAATTSSNKVSSSNDNDALNLSKRKTGNVSANLNLGTASSSSASVSKSGKTSILNSTNTRTNTTTSAGLSKTTTEAKTTSTTVPTANTSATNQATGIDKFSNLGIAELLAYSNFPPDSVIPVIHVDIKVAPAADKMPKLKNLNEWLAAHPQYTIDLAKLMQTPFTPSVTAAGNRSRTKENTAVSTSESTATCAAGGSITTGGSARNTASKLLNNTSAAGGSSRGQLPVNPAARATPSATPISSAAAAPQPSSSSKNSAGVSASAIAKMANDMSSFAGLKNLLQIGVFKKSTGASLSQDKWPMLTELAKWLDKNPDCNVHSSYADIAKAILSKGYHNRLGGDFAGTPSMSTSSTNSAAVLNSATATQSLSSMFPSTSSSSSTAALTQLLSAAANPMAFSSASVSQISPSTSSLISGSVTGGNITSTSATTSSASSLQNIEALQMQLLLQQLMTPSMMTNYNPYSLLGGTGSTSAASTSNGTVNANSLNNLTANLNAGALLGNSAPSTSKANNNNNSNEALMAVLLGLGGPAAEQMTASLLNQALTGITPTSHISTATNLSGTGGSKTSNSTSATAQSLASLTNRVQPVNSMSNSAASSLMAEAALAAEILTNPTLMTSMLNPLGPISSNYGVNNNQSNKASASSSTAFTSNSLTNPSLSAASSMAGLDAATIATLAATFGGLDAATLAALAGVVSLPTTAPTASTSRKATTSAASTSAEPLISVTSTSRTTNPNRAGLLNAVVEKLAKSNTPAAANSTSSEVNDAPKDVKELADEDEEAKS